MSAPLFLHQLVQQVSASQAGDATASKSLQLQQQLKQAFIELIQPLLTPTQPLNERTYQQQVLTVLSTCDELLEGADDGVQQLFADTLWLLWHMSSTQSADNTATYSEYLTQFTREAYDKEVIAKHVMKQTLPEEMLEQMLVYKPKALNSAFVRVRTAELYSQTKYNLLREESEGYAKLVTELSYHFAAVGHSKAQSHAAATDKIISKVKSLIGYFDLDPNRIIDLLLQVFAAHLTAASINVQQQCHSFLQIVKLFNTQSIAHVVGFRFQSYTTKDTVVPESWCHVVTVLLMSDIVTVQQLYGHLSPSDEWLVTARQEAVIDQLNSAKKVNMVSLRDSDEKDSAAARPPPIRSNDNVSSAAANDDPSTIANNAIAAEQPLTEVLAPPTVNSVSLTAGATAHGTIDIIQPELNQKLQLLRWLVHHSAIKQAWDMLRHLQDIVPASDPAVGAALTRYTLQLSTPLHQTLSAYTTRSLISPPKAAPTVLDLSSLSPTSTLDGYTSFIQSQLSDSDTDNNTSKHSDSLRALLPLLQHASVYLANDLLTLIRLLRATAAAVTQLRQQQQASAIDPVAQHGWRYGHTADTFELPMHIEHLLTDVLLPAFTLVTPQSPLSSEMWAILSQLPYTIRYRLYGYWHTSLYDNSTFPELATIKAHIIYRTKYFRKRLSTSNTKELGRLLSKFALHNPTIVFDLLLQQVSSFDNMIVPVIDVMKYMTPLAFDVMAWTLLTQLADTKKPKMKGDGLNEAHWYQTLSTFTATIFRRYPDQMELEPLVVYLIEQLKNDQAVELLLLKELLSNLASVDPYEETGDIALEGRAGSRQLQTETTQQRQQIKNRTKCIRTLMTALIGTAQSPHNYLFPLYTLVVQQKGAVVFNAESEHIRAISETYDKCQEAMLQFSDAVDVTVVSDQALATYLPSLHDVVHTYNIQPEDAFHMLRRCLATPRIQQAPSAVKDGDASMNGDATQDGLANTCRTFHDEHVWQAITPKLYATFWRLSINQIYVPTKQFDSTVKKLKQQMQTLETSATPATINSNAKERERLRRVVDKLAEDQSRQTAEQHSTVAKLRKEKDSWLSPVTDYHATTRVLLSTCILPRVLTSTVDALYTAKFIQMLQTLHTPYFNTVLLYDQIIQSIAPLISSCSNNEIRRVALFLKEIVHHTNQLTANRGYYERTASNSVCFAVSVDHPTGTKLTHDQFKQFTLLWNKQLTAVIVQFLQSETAMEQTNALLLMSKLGTEYPRYLSHSQQIETELSSMMEKQEKQSALRLMSTRIHAMLQAHRKGLIQDVAATPKPAAPPPEAKVKAEPKAADATAANAAKPASQPQPTKADVKPIAQPKAAAEQDGKPPAPPSKSPPHHDQQQPAHRNQPNGRKRDRDPSPRASVDSNASHDIKHEAGQLVQSAPTPMQQPPNRQQPQQQRQRQQQAPQELGPRQQQSQQPNAGQTAPRNAHDSRPQERGGGGPIRQQPISLIRDRDGGPPNANERQPVVVKQQQQQHPADRRDDRSQPPNITITRTIANTQTPPPAPPQPGRFTPPSASPRREELSSAPGSGQRGDNKRRRDQPFDDRHPAPIVNLMGDDRSLAANGRADSTGGIKRQRGNVYHDPAATYSPMQHQSPVQQQQQQFQGRGDQRSFIARGSAPDYNQGYQDQPPPPQQQQAERGGRRGGRRGR